MRFWAGGIVFDEEEERSYGTSSGIGEGLDSKMSMGEFCELCSTIVVGHNLEEMDSNNLNESRQDDFEMQKTANGPIQKWRSFFFKQTRSRVKL